MKILKPSRVRAYSKATPDAADALTAWLKVARVARWRSIQDVRTQYPHADAVKVNSGHTATVFNIAGNKYRLIVAINYQWSVVYVLRFLTHVEYDRNKWKQQL